MKDYNQPVFYRFNQDSILLVNEVLEEIKSSRRLLDIGAGCGVIGIEIARRIRVDSLTLLEPQEDFNTYLNSNIQFFIPEVKVNIVHKTINDFNDSSFDLIVCNPPYYLPGDGEMSKDLRRNIARSFTLDNWEILLLKIFKLLSQEGKAFILVPKLKKVIDLVDNISSKYELKITKIEKIKLFIYELEL